MSATPPLTATAARTAGSRRNTLIVRTIIVVALLGLFALLAFMAVQWFGVVWGVEFSPDTFSQRRFYYKELPLVRVRISPVYHEDVTGPLEQRVRKDAELFPPSTIDPPRWHLVQMERGSSEYTGDALIVFRYFDDEGETARRWLRWNRQHKELAKILWPAVVEACRGEHYDFTPELFATAERLTTIPNTDTTVDEFRAAIGRAMARQYVQLANAEQGLEHHDSAVKLYTAALAHDASDIAALRGRALSHAALGEGAKANADRDAVKKLQRAAQ